MQRIRLIYQVTLLLNTLLLQSRSTTAIITQLQTDKGPVYSSTKADQLKVTRDQSFKCQALLRQDAKRNDTDDDKTYCPTEMGRVLCWPRTLAGKVAQLPCPAFENFYVNQTAKRYCQLDGVWKKQVNSSLSWTNFSACFSKDKSSLRSHNIHLNILIWIGHIGYSISLIALVIAILIMSTLRKLRCPRNTIHINLFVAFAIRCIGHFINLGSSKYFTAANNDVFTLCRIQMTFLTFAVEASWTWVFIEALYLYVLISAAVMSEGKQLLILCIFLGWGMPLIIATLWFLMKLNFDNRQCWQQFNAWGADIWVVNVYNVLTMLINFFFFISIVRILFLKMRAQQQPTSASKKLAKSTLVLIFVFGMYNIVFLPSELIPQDQLHEKIMLAKLYYENFFGTFQGFFVSLLFCFTNSEVGTEIRRIFNCNSLQFKNNQKNRKSIALSRSRGASKLEVNQASAMAEPELTNGSDQPIRRPQFTMEIDVEHEPSKRKAKSRKKINRCETLQKTAIQPLLHKSGGIDGEPFKIIACERLV